MKENKCVMCGQVIPEGRIICPICEEAEPNLNTTKITIHFRNITDIAEFVNLASACRDDVVVKSGHFAINAKSIMGLYSLDLTKPLKVEFYGDIPYEVKEGMKKFIVD